jgi:hypothetical protein
MPFDPDSTASRFRKAWQIYPSDLPAARFFSFFLPVKRRWPPEASGSIKE